jgi:hypothetical protein
LYFSLVSPPSCASSCFNHLKLGKYECCRETNSALPAPCSLLFCRFASLNLLNPGAPMTLHTTPTGGPNLPTAEPALPVLVKSEKDTPVPLPGEKSTGSDESPADTDSPGETEFKEGGYGWSVL